MGFIGRYIPMKTDRAKAYEKFNACCRAIPNTKRHFKGRGLGCVPGLVR